MPNYYYQCKECSSGFLAEKEPEKCSSCGGQKFKRRPYGIYPKPGLVTRVKKMVQGIFSY